VRGRSWRRYEAALAAVFLSAPVSGAQQPAARTLPKANAELDEPFSAIASIRELRDGRVLVVDSRERALKIVDRGLTTVEQIGRNGAGPGEYEVPGRLLALPGDSTILTDPRNRRLLILGPDGKPVSTIGAADGRGAWNPASPAPRFTDGAGNVYFLGSRIANEGKDVQLVDTAAIIRADRRTGALDTVAFVRLPKTEIRTQSSGGRITGVQIFLNPFAPQDEWVVAADGRVGIVRVADYKIEWITPNGIRRVGQPVRHTQIAVTERDFAETQRGRAAAAGRGAAEAAPAGLPPDWPKTKPPFLREAALASPDGRMWVLRSRPAGDVVPVYDVFDSTGRLAERVTFPARSRLVGFGATAAYVARLDPDDLEYLQRLPLR
jgi:hypothetical protein